MGTSILHTYIYYTHIHMILYIVCMYNMYISTLPLKHLGTQAAALLLVNERLIVKVPDPRCVEVCIASEPLQTQTEREGGGGVGQTCGKQKSKGHVSQYARSQRQLTSEHRDKGAEETGAGRFRLRELDRQTDTASVAGCVGPAGSAVELALHREVGLDRVFAHVKIAPLLVEGRITARAQTHRPADAAIEIC